MEKYRFRIGETVLVDKRFNSFIMGKARPTIEGKAENYYRLKDNYGRIIWQREANLISIK
ncbi:MAG: hypothetical protein KAV87_65020 [Desulfobacteraceae bacterium]|nr:hypothetical protein [Desulfobacteraceae bacterium]